MPYVVYKLVDGREVYLVRENPQAWGPRHNALRLPSRGVARYAQLRAQEQTTESLQISELSGLGLEADQ
jgi:hypothetical protein